MEKNSLNELKDIEKHLKDEIEDIKNENNLLGKKLEKLQSYIDDNKNTINRIEKVKLVKSIGAVVIIFEEKNNIPLVENYTIIVFANEDDENITSLKESISKSKRQLKIIYSDLKGEIKRNNNKIKGNNNRLEHIEDMLNNIIYGTTTKSTNKIKKEKFKWDELKEILQKLAIRYDLKLGSPLKQNKIDIICKDLEERKPNKIVICKSVGTILRRLGYKKNKKSTNV